MRISPSARRLILSISLLTLVSTAPVKAEETAEGGWWCHNGTCCNLATQDPHDCQFNCGTILQGWVWEWLVNLSCSA